MLLGIYENEYIIKTSTINQFKGHTISLSLLVFATVLLPYVHVFEGVFESRNTSRTGSKRRFPPSFLDARPSEMTLSFV